jgi:hypothetical protein
MCDLRPWGENHYATATFLHKPSVFRLVWINGHKFDFCRVSVEKYTVTLSYLFARSVLENQNTHAVLPTMGIVRAIEMLRQFAATQADGSRPYRSGVTIS